MRRAALALAILALVAGCDSANALRLFPPRVPDAIAAFHDGGSVRVVWDEVPGASGYRVYYDRSPDVDASRHYEVVETDIAELRISIPGGLAIASEEVWFRVAARRGNDEGPLSPAVRAAEVEPDFLLWPVWTFVPSDPAGRCGAAVSAIDREDDGYADLVVGCPGAQSGEGGLFVFDGTPQGLEGDPVVSRYGSDFGPAVSGFGSALLRLDDWKGRDLLVVSAPGTPGADLFVFDAVTLSLTTGLVPARPGSAVLSSSAEYGTSIALAGDLDNDGLDDLAVGAPSPGRGCIVVLSQAPGVAANAICDDEPEFGRVVARAGDLDGDAFDDVAVGIPSARRVEGILGAPNIFTTTGAARTEALVGDASAEEELGAAIVGIGEIDGNTRESIVVGTPSFRLERGEVPGKISIVTFTGPMELPTITGESAADQDGARLGASLALTDVNPSDPEQEVIVGAPGRNGFVLADVAFDSTTQQTVTSIDSSVWTSAGLPALGTRVTEVFADEDSQPDVAASGSNGVALFLGTPVGEYGPRVSAGLPVQGTVGTPLRLAGAFAEVDPYLDGQCWIDWGDGSAETVIPDCSSEALVATQYAYSVSSDDREPDGRFVIRVFLRLRDGRIAEAATFARITAP